VAIWKLEWEGISQCIVIVIILSIGSGYGGESGLPFPILVFRDEFTKCFLVFESTVCGVGNESSGNTTVMFIWFSICEIPVDDSIIVLQKEFGRSTLKIRK
jgi:hypothetical protein